MKILVLAPGTLGDVAPAAGLAQALVADGHAVTVVADAEHAALVKSSASTHAPIHASMSPTEPGVDAPEGDGPGVRAYLRSLRLYMRAAAEAAMFASPGAEVVLTNAISPYGHDIAEAIGARSADALLQPARPSAAYPPMIASGRNLGPRGNRLAGAAAARVPAPVDPACAWVRQELGLPPRSRLAGQRQRNRAASPVHHGISSVVLPRPDDWPDELSLDGFWWPPAQTDWRPPADLADFLRAGPAPVLVSLGSIPLGSGPAAELAKGLHLGTGRVLLQGDQMRPVAERLGPDRALHIGVTPHDWLFTRVAAVVHQAGAGVAAAALRAGVPSVPVPVHTDQPFWARRLEAIGAATSPVPAKRLTAAALDANIREATGSDALRTGALTVSSQLAQEDGTLPIRHWIQTLAGHTA